MFTRVPSRRIRWVIELAVLLLVVSPGLLSAGSGPVGWTKYAGNPVLNPGTSGAWDDGEVWDPAVLLDGSTYRMWYTGDRGANPMRIGYATSPNGLSWTRGSTNAVLSDGASGAWDSDGVRAPTVIKDGMTYKMWYTGRDGDGTYRIGYATSPDGIVWTRYGSTSVVDLGDSGAWDELRAAEPTVVKVGASSYKMWYVGVNSDWGWAIGYATSTDGITWNKYAGNPVLEGAPPPNWDYGVYAPSVILDNGVYRMLYAGGNFPETAYETGYATSPDGITWTKQGRVLPQGPDGAFDRYSADFPALLRVGDAYKAWYSGWGDTYRIGYADAPWKDLPYTAYLPLALRVSGSCSPVWSDDFHDYHSGWVIYNTEDVTYAYVDGEYQMLVGQKNAYYWATPGLQMTDGVIAVKVRFASEGDNLDNGGIMFGQQLDENESFYRFVVVRNGDYCIQRHDAGADWVDLKCAAASGYQAYPAWNTLKVVRSGDSIAAYLNGQWQATVSDGTYMNAGQVGLVVGTSDGGADLRFDDYAIYPVSCGD